MWHWLWLVGAKVFRPCLHDRVADNVVSVYVSQHFLGGVGRPHWQPNSPSLPQRGSFLALKAS